jgi:hypothetical protein
MNGDTNPAGGTPGAGSYCRSIRDMLADPVVLAVMASDGVTEQMVWAQVNLARLAVAPAGAGRFDSRDRE